MNINVNVDQNSEAYEKMMFEKCMSIVAEMIRLDELEHPEAA